MICKIFFCSEPHDIPEKSWRRRWRKLANVKSFCFSSKRNNNFVVGFLRAPTPDIAKRYRPVEMKKILGGLRVYQKMCANLVS